MAEEGEGKRSRFLSKSKWGKVFKENDQPAPPGKVNSFNLNDDVVDFLKPSTEKSKPKIDIALAQRWPSAHEVRRATETPGATTPTPQWAGYRKPRRREGLSVSFARTAPDVIGEGGDEAPEPPSEVSRKKAAVMRSVSDRRPAPLEDNTAWPGTQAPRPTPRQARPPAGLEEDFRPQPVRRVQTSHNEFSPPVQRKHASPPIDPVHHRPSLGRTPTGFNGQAEAQHNLADYESDEETDVPPVPALPSPEFTATSGQSSYSSAGPSATGAAPRIQRPESPHEPMSPIVVRRRDNEMQASEGMALRRASTLLMTEDHEQRLRNSEAGFQPSPQFYNALSNISTSNIVNESPASTKANLSPEMALSPGGPGPSPFEDPRYIKRHSGEVPTVAAPKQPPQTQSLRQQRPFEQPSHIKPPSQPHAPPEPLPLRTAPATTGRPGRTVEQPSYMRAAQPSAPSALPPHQEARDQSIQDERPSYMRGMQSPEGSFVPSRPPPAPAQSMQMPQDHSMNRDRSPMRDRVFDAQPPPEKPRPFYAQASHSSGSLNRFPASPKIGHSRTSSRDDNSESLRSPTSPGFGSKPSPSARVQSQSPQNQSPRGTLLDPGNAGRGAPSPYARGPSPADYFSGPRPAPGQPARSPAANLRHEEAGRPGSSGSARSAYRPLPSPQPPVQSDPTADLALSDFAGRVAHMRGVFSLTAEKERPSQRCTPETWMRAALWWYLRGKAGLEAQLQQRGQDTNQQRELLTQAHVDIAKAWWIISEKLSDHDLLESPQSVGSPSGQSHPQTVTLVQSHIKSLSVQMQRNQLMPPHQSLIQGQDTTIWLEYPRFASDAAAVLSGAVSKSVLLDTHAPTLSPLEAFPLSDTRDVFCYGRFPVDVSINTDEADTDRVVFPCMLSMLRGKRDFLASFTVASQSELVNLQLGLRQGDQRGLTWHDVSWKANSHSLAIRLPRGFDLTVRMQERDYRSLWNLVEYARKVEHSLRPQAEERQVHEATIAELQYADSSGAHAFPADKLRNCSALVFERLSEHRDGSGVRKMHDGYRLLLVTDAAHKSLSSVSHSVCGRSPLIFEFITDAAAHGTTAMVIRVREDNRQIRMLMVFPDMASRQAFYDTLNGLTVGPDETIVGKMGLTGVNIQDALQSGSFSTSSHPALKFLQWQKLGVTNHHSDDPNTRIPETVESESLRVIARHAAGCITDRLNLGKGELLMRLPCGDSPAPAIQLLRAPQADLTISIDIRQAPQNVADGITELYNLAQQHLTIRTFMFASPADLHAFQASVTGHTVRYDGIASTFSISHRMMVISISQKKQATNARLQVVQEGGSITQILAFMEDFTLAEALCFKVKSTDTFERVKGDGKSRKWAVKFVDAKFKLPRQEKGELVEPEERVRRRFVNLEALEYAEEHDDITVGFDTEEARDRFAEALPAEAKVGRGLTLKRRI